MNVYSQQSNEKSTLSQLESFLLENVNIFKEKFGPSEFKEYVFGIFFLKHLSYTFYEEKWNIIQYYLDQGKTKSQSEIYVSKKDKYKDTYYIPECAKWKNIKNLKHDIGSELNKATEAIEEEFDDPELRKIVIERFMELAKVKFK